MVMKLEIGCGCGETLDSGKYISIKERVDKNDLNPKSLNYILWLIKKLEIQMRLQVYDLVTEVKIEKRR